MRISLLTVSVLAALLTAAAGLTPERAGAADLHVSGYVTDWIDPSDVPDPGKDLEDTKFSEPEAVQLDVVNTAGKPWIVWISRRCENRREWPEEWQVSLRRTSDNEKVYGGTEFSDPLSPAPRRFVKGEGDTEAGGIDVQLRVRGISIMNALPGRYECEIRYELETL